MKHKFNRLLACILSGILILSCMGTALAETENVQDDASSAAESVLTEQTPEQLPSEASEEEAGNTPVELDGLEAAGEKTILYVAPDGRDTNAGTIDSPLATFVGARDRLREIRNAGMLGSGGAVVYFRGGTYTINNTIELRSEDKGTAEAPIIYRNYPDEEVDFVGAATLSWDDFEKVTDQAVLSRIVDEDARNHIYAADLHALGFKDLPRQVWPGSYSYWEDILPFLEKEGIKKPDANAAELIVNGKSMQLARYPNNGEMTITEVIEPGSPLTGELMEVAVADNRVLEWTNAKDAIMYGTFQYSWGTLATDVGEINTKTNSIKAKYPLHHLGTKGQMFHVYNLIEEIDVPGEYYIDREAGMLYLYPPEGEIEQVAYTTLEKQMFILYDADYVTIRGINMKYMRHRAMNMDSATEYAKLIDSEICYTSKTNSIYVSGSNCQILDCWFHDVEGGVELQGGDRATLTRGNNLLENCKFERCNRLTSSYMYAAAVTRVGNKIRHNDISQSVHSVISLSGNFHEISYNNIYEACTNTDDMGAIYSGRDITQRGNQVLYNYIHDIGGADRGANGVHGIFFDDWWSAADVAGNVFENITGAGVMLAGSYNVMDNNMYINCGESMRLTRSFNYGNPDNFTVYKTNADKVPYLSDVWVEAFPEIVNAFDENGAPDMNNYIVATNNLLYNSPPPAASDEVKKTATIENNVSFAKDPGFYDLAGRNYLLKEDSEVFEKIPGFKPIPFTRMGMYSDRAVSRIKKAYVFCIDSPYVYKNGEIVKSDKTEAFVENGTMYVPLRSGAEAIGATVDYNEETAGVTVSTGAKSIMFTSNGTLNSVLVNGIEYSLSKPIINKAATNYISVADLVNIFEKQLVVNDGIAVISDIKDLFNHEGDAELLRYIGDRLTVY